MRDKEARMLVMAAKTGICFVAILTMLGVLQSQTLTDMVVAFLAAGIVPGINLQIPAEMSLICVAGVFMVLVAWLFKVYLTDRTRVLDAVREFPNFSEDPGYEVL